MRVECVQGVKGIYKICIITLTYEKEYFYPTQDSGA